MIYSLASLLCGLLFGIGLTISQMINPTKILDFLDFFGNWDPSLALVMFSALLVSGLSYHFMIKKTNPKLAPQYYFSIKNSIDSPLIIGSCLFGIGWGLSGYCPGPAITALGLGIWDAVYFMVGMVLSGIIFYIKKI